MTFKGCFIFIKKIKIKYFHLTKYFHEENKQLPDQFFEASWITNPYLSHVRIE